MVNPEAARSAEDVRAVQRWMTLDLWMAMGEDSQLFDVLYDEKGFADMWSLCLAIVRGTALTDGSTEGAER